MNEKELKGNLLKEELNNQGHLKTLSINGGEPTIYPNIGDLICLFNKWYNKKVFEYKTWCTNKTEQKN